MGLFGMSYNNPAEAHAEERGYAVMGIYDTKEEINHVINQLHGAGVHAMKARHTVLQAGMHIIQWFLWVKQDDLHLLVDKKPEDKVK